MRPQSWQTGPWLTFVIKLTSGQRLPHSLVKHTTLIVLVWIKPRRAKCGGGWGCVLPTWTPPHHVIVNVIVNPLTKQCFQGGPRKSTWLSTLTFMPTLQGRNTKNTHKTHRLAVDGWDNCQFSTLSVPKSSLIYASVRKIVLSLSGKLLHINGVLIAFLGRCISWCFLRNATYTL